MTVTAILKSVRISDVWRALGGPEPVRGRACAFYRDGDNPQAVALDDEKGCWYDHRDNVGGGVLDLVQQVQGGSRADALRFAANVAGIAVDGRPPDPDQQRIVVAEYSYVDAAGRLLYQVVRYKPKDFKQRYPDGAGGWIWRKLPQQVLYRLPEVMEAPITFLVEGERDCETLHEYGFVATTNAGGAKAPWLPQFTEALRGREVNIIPDNDEPGWRRATSVARALFGTAGLIRIVDLPKETKDVSDWFAAGHSECELIAMLEGGIHA